MQCVCVRGWAIGLVEIVCVRVCTWGGRGGTGGGETGGKKGWRVFGVRTKRTIELETKYAYRIIVIK